MSTPVKGYFVIGARPRVGRVSRRAELEHRFGKAMPADGATPEGFFGAVARQPKRLFPDQEWCRQGDGGEPPWFGVNAPDPVTGLLRVRAYWAANNPAGRQYYAFADRGHRERVAVAGSWSDVRAALAARHGVPVSSVEVRRSLPLVVRQ